MRVAGAFRESVARWGERPFLEVLPGVAAVYGGEAGAMSYAEAGRRVGALAERYGAAGYGVGHRVGLMLGNRPEFFLHWLALNACGASVVPLNAELRAAELGYLVEHSGLGLVVAAEAGVEVGVPVVGVGEGVPRAGGECAVLYTSGTTGRPKGCVLTDGYFLRAGAWYAGCGGLAAIRPGEERLITPLPMVHMNAMAYSTMAMMLTGGCVVPLDRFHPRAWWGSVRESGATIVHYLGVMPSMLMGLEAGAGDREHRVRFGFGAGVDPRLHGAFEARFGFPLLEAWAMTETGAGAVVIASEEPRHVGRSCFGRAGVGVEVRIVDEGGVEVGEGVPGEMLVRAGGEDGRAGFFDRYLHDPAATEAAWAGGWFHTGDVVSRGEDGSLYFVDRRKNVIRRSGENIAAVEVESVVRRHPAVREVAVAGVADEMRGEEVMACVVLREGVGDRGVAEGIVRAALVELSYYKVPGWVAFVEALPLTATQKVQRGELKAMAAGLAGEAFDVRGMKVRGG